MDRVLSDASRPLAFRAPVISIMPHQHAGNGLRMIWNFLLSNMWNGVGLSGGCKEFRRSQSARSICVSLSQLLSVVDFHSLLLFHRQPIWGYGHAGLCQWFLLILELIRHGVGVGQRAMKEVPCFIITMHFVVEITAPISLS
jgi:hypothetical protein